MKLINKFWVIFILLCFLQTGCQKKDNYHIILENNNCEIIDEYDSNRLGLFGEYDLDYSTETHNYFFDKWILKEAKGRNYTYTPTYKIEERFYCITFDSNEGNLEEGKSIQYLKYGQMPKPPTFSKDMYEFIGYSEEVKEVVSDYTYVAEYETLNINKVAPLELIKNIRGGFNFTNFYDDYDLLDGNFDHVLTTLKDSGFNAISIPIIWLKYTDDNYIIQEEALIKVKALVDQALEYNFYVIITSYDSYQHQWSSLNYYQYEKTIEIMNSIWGQLGEYFIEYDERVMFSCFNEPRDYITNAYSREGAMILNLLNEMFIELIRSQGYNNKYRHILITPIWGKSDAQHLRYFKIPEDDFLIVSLHSYAPFGLVHEESYEEVSWSAKEKEYQAELVGMFKNIKEKFLDKGIAVLMTEYGSRDKENTIERSKWLEFYLNVAYNCGIKCFTWDSAIAHYEIDYTFSVIDKVTGGWKYIEFANVYNKLYLQGEVLPFFDEINNTTQKLNDEVIVPDIVTDMLTKETYEVDINYDEEAFEIGDGKLYAKEEGVYWFNFTLNGYSYHYKITILKDYLLYDCSFALEVRSNRENLLQCYIITENKDVMRVEYDWYTSNSSILTINQYSTLTIINDGVVAVIAIHKETNEIGVIELVIKNGGIVSFANVFDEEDVYGS